MSHILTFGYFGTETGTMSGSTTHKNPEEPTLSLDKLIKFFNLEKEKAKIDLDISLVWQGSQSTEKEKIKEIWKEIISKRWLWKDLRPKILELLNLGETLLPVVFEITYDKLEFEIVDCEHTILVSYDDLDKLNKLKNLIEKEHSNRISPYGRVGSSKELTIEKKKP